jgi:hypothetical protein
VSSAAVLLVQQQQQQTKSISQINEIEQAKNDAQYYL